MRRDLMRRLEKLEQGRLQTSRFQAKLRACARGWGVGEEAFLRAAQGHEQDLRRGLRDHGFTWETFLLLRDIAGQAERAGGAAQEESK